MELRTHPEKNKRKQLEISKDVDKQLITIRAANFPTFYDQPIGKI